MLYEILKTSKLGASFAPDMYTALWAQKLARDGEVKTLSGIPPLTFPSNGQPLLDYLISGNTVQSGTPTPDNPVMPQGTGERTGNLINVPALSSVRWATQYPALLNAINSLPNGVYTMSISYELVSRNDVTDSSVCGWYISKDSRALSNIRLGWETARVGEITTVVDTFTINDDNRGTFTSLYLYGCGINGVGPTGTAIVTNIMLNEGSTALPYEPYGYKIPISCGGTTTPVYLGEVETTRRVKKLVLTGTEDSKLENNVIFAIPCASIISGYYQSLCDRYVFKNTYNDVYYNDGTFAISSTRLLIHDENYTTVQDFKTYLQQQYAAGTPVTVWYVLATETTGIVNEPLMKIGEYADTLSMEQAGVEIPTARGTNTLDVLTDVKPSNVYLKYKEV